MINNFLHVFGSPLIDVSFSFPIGSKGKGVKKKKRIISLVLTTVVFGPFKTNCQSKIQLTMTPPHTQGFLWAKRPTEFDSKLRYPSSHMNWQTVLKNCLVDICAHFLPVV